MQLNPAVQSPESADGSALTELSVGGMNCQSCVRHVTEAIESVPGVRQATVDLDRGRASVRWEEGSRRDLDGVARAVRQAGYEPKADPIQSELQISGMTCSNCVQRVTKALQNVSGVERAVVNLDQGRATIHWKANCSGNPQALIDAVAASGYRANLVRPDSGETAKQRKWSPLAGWEFNVTVGSAVTIVLMLAEWGLRVGMERWYHWLAFALVLPVQALCGARFYRGAWMQIRVGSSNMDTLVALGSTTAFGYSVWALFSGWQGHLFFMESAAIITLVSLGHWIETKVSARAAKTLRGLLNLAPQTARLLAPNGLETVVPVSQLQVGDQIVIKPGDRIATDAEVIDGVSAIDEAMLTGESVPVEKHKGSKTFGGTVNLHGWLLARVTATGQSTALAQIIAVVQRAQTSRANIQKLGDRVSSIFVPIVILIAIVTGLWWGLAPESALTVSRWLEPLLWHAHHPSGRLAAAIYHAAAVLIIACPCAMGLATPVAIMAGTNVAAERGILIRDGIALEKTGQITSILFDKTGTLTEGKVAVAAIDDLLESHLQSVGLHKIAASIAKPSLHPLSQAIATLSHATIPTVEWQELRGLGVQTRLQSDVGGLSETIFRLGSMRWLRESGIDFAPQARFIEEWSAKGATVLGLSADQRLLGLFALRDPVKAAGAEVIAQLRRQGKKVHMVTGDNKPTALAIARVVGIEEGDVFAEVRPDAKAEIVRQLQERGERVAFIGDGINDAPALEQADLGIAVSRATDIAREAADMILLKSDIHGIPEALNLAQATLRTIKQNLFWAFFYNAAGVPLAALGFMSPILSALAMGLSDLIVIGNALRLRRWRG
jgi:P-type Cu+ transporter